MATFYIVGVWKLYNIYIYIPSDHFACPVIWESCGTVALPTVTFSAGPNLRNQVSGAKGACGAKGGQGVRLHGVLVEMMVAGRPGTLEEHYIQ